MELESGRTILIDANALAYRSLYAHETLTVTIKDKTIYTGLIYGFIEELIRLKTSVNPKEILVFWDGGSARKKAMFPAYKKDRKLKTKKMNYKDVINSIKYCIKVLRFMGLEQYQIIGEEGDDIISSYIHQNPEKKYYIFSNDHDFFQLLSNNVEFMRMRPRAMEYWDKKEFMKTHGFRSKYYAQYLAIVGDHTDKIPGVKGLGVKTVTPMFMELKKPTLKRIFKHADKFDLTNVNRRRLKDGKKDAYFFYKLVKLCKDLPLEPMVGTGLKKKKLIKVLTKLRFVSIYGDKEKMRVLCGL